MSFRLRKQLQNRKCPSISQKTSLKWLTVAMPFLKIKERLAKDQRETTRETGERLERDKREMELWLMA